jgi:hypothetical protein
LAALIHLRVAGPGRSAVWLGAALLVGWACGAESPVGGGGGTDAASGGADAAVATGGTAPVGGTGGGGGPRDASASGGAVGTADAALDGSPRADASDDAPLDALPPLLDVHFVDVTLEVGIDTVQATDFSCSIPVRSCDAESPNMTGGAAAGDFDGDGHVDLYVTRLDGPDHLYRNRGDGTFEDVTAAAGLSAPIHSNGAGFSDIDNDGDQDLLVTAMGDTRHYLYVNDGAGQFTEDAVARGTDLLPDELHQGTSVSFGDYDLDGWSDVYMGEWRPAYLFQTQPPPANARLLHNRGGAEPGYFDDVTQAAGVALDGLSSMGVFAFSAAFSDLDEDGLPDLAIAADFGTSRLFWNAGDGTFIDGTDAAGVGTDENGMGSAIGDYDGDGRLDWFVTSIFDPAHTCDTVTCTWGYTGNRLYRNTGSRTFIDETDAAGVRDGGWGWGTAFFDYDNDGDLDLIMTDGMYFRAATTEDAFNAQPMRLWRRDGSDFTEVAIASGLRDTDSGKGLLVLDYDEDGDLDVFVANNGAAPRLYRNEGGNTLGFLRVRLHGSTSTRDAWGTKLWMRRAASGTAVVRELRGGNDFLGQSEAVAHFGLGASSDPVAELRVRWPSGVEQTLTDVAPNQTLDLLEPTGGDL